MKPLSSQVILFLQLLFAGTFIVLKAQLPKVPTTSAFTDVEALFLLGFLTASGYEYIRTHKQPISQQIGSLLTILLLVVLLGISISVSAPAFKNYPDAEAFTEAHKAAAELGAQLAQEQDISTFPKQAATLQLSAGEAEVAREAFQAAKAAPTIPANEIAAEVAHTVPVKLGSWTCNEFGCSYANDLFIWTLLPGNLAFATVINVLILGYLIVISHAFSWRRLTFRR